MARLLLPSNMYIGAGGVITFVGTAKDQAVYWYLVGHDEDHNEISALGSINNEITLTDSSFCATNVYNSPLTEPLSGHHDHLEIKAVIV
jgi:hypothetical protein